MTSRWTRALILCVVLLTAAVLAADAVVSISSGLYLNFSSGVWLALARDTYEGVFYRPLWNGVEYGGTRYFPMLFVAIAALMRAGVAPVTAAVTVSMLGLAAMAAAVFVLLKRLSASSPLAMLGAALSAAPYFVHQTGFAVRCEPIAAAFAISGLAVLAPIEKRPDSIRRELIAAALFSCAFITKITCVYGPAAATLALLCAGRRWAAARVAAITGLGIVLVVAVVNFASDGRAIESFRACALAGSTLSTLLSAVAVTRTLQLIGVSHLLTVVFFLAVLTLVVAVRARQPLAALYFLTAVVVTAVIFTSPGTTMTSHIVDAYVAAIILITATIAAQTGPLRLVGTAALMVVTVWAAAQNVVLVAGMIEQGVVRERQEGSRQLVATLKGCGGSILAESPLIPILVNHRPVVLDPFAFRVMAVNNPDVVHDLTGRLRRREFTCVVLEHDPTVPAGYGWYANVNFGESVIDTLLQSYRYDGMVGGERFYRPVE
jgi:hypothetical protein